MKFFLFPLLGILLCFCQNAQQPAVILVTAPMPIAQTTTESRPQRILAAALRGVGRPYVGHLLDKKGTEQLVVDTMQLDCWTFTEYCLAQALINAPSDFEAQVQTLRYRNGEVKGFGSRLHYFTEWALQAQSNGYLTDITRDLGGLTDTRKVQFISKHPAAYPLCNTPACKEAIAASEQRLSSAERYVIPKARVKEVAPDIQDGDIIGITSAITDLDFAHQGIAVRRNGQVYLIHASSDLGKVAVSAEPLHTYLMRNKKQSGIVVLRAQ